MSFKNRLTLFFVVIVIVPMAVTAVLLLKTSSQFSTGKTDVELAQNLKATNSIYNSYTESLEEDAQDLSKKKQFRYIWTNNTSDELKEYLSTYLSKKSLPQPGLFSSIQAYNANNKLVWSLGRKESLGGVRLESKNAKEIKYIDVAYVSPEIFINRASTLTGGEFILTDINSNKIIASSLPIVPGANRNIVLDKGYRTDSMKLNITGLDDQTQGLEVKALVIPDQAGLLERQPVLVALFVILFLLAIGLAAILQKRMRDQIAEMVRAARDISDGKFDVVVPTRGNDEVSALAYEINQMSARLKEQIHTLEEKSNQLENSIQRFGETMGSILDKPKLMTITLDGALELCNSDFGTLNYFDKDNHSKISSNVSGKRKTDKLPDGLDKELAALELLAQSSPGIQSDSWQGYNMLAIAIYNQDHSTVLATMALARHNSIYRQSEEDIFTYLSQSAALSLDNIILHEKLLVAAVTDDLTGLSNKAKFQDTLEKEVRRAHRFDHDLALIMADVDDFKDLNDTYGHLEGDKVLVEIAKQINFSVREVDESFRWGGEEFALLLPETDAEQAVEAAERIRSSVEELDFEEYSRKVTLSLGVAILKEGHSETLVRSADEALYRAKRSGKNKVVRNDL